MPSTDASLYTRGKRLEVSATVAAVNADAPFVKNDGKAGYIPTNNCVVEPYIPPIIMYKFQQLRNVAGLTNDGSASINGVGTNARFQSMFSIFAIRNEVYIADIIGSHIRKYDPITGLVTTYIGRSNSPVSPTIVTNLIENPHAIAYDGGDIMYISQRYYNILKVNMRTNTVTSHTITIPGVTQPIASAIVYSSGVLYCADTEQNYVFSLDLSTMRGTIIAGSPGISGYKDGFGSETRLFTSSSGVTGSAITVDGKRNLYIADKGNHVIRKISLRSLEVSTFYKPPFTPGVIVYSPIDDTLYYASTFQMSKMYLKDTAVNEVIATNDDGLSSLAVTSVNTLFNGSSRFVLYQFN